MPQYRERLVRAMRYELLFEHNPAKLVVKVNEALATGAVFCGGPISNQGQLVQAVVWPEEKELEEVPDPKPVAPSVEDQLRALGSDREGLGYDTHVPPAALDTGAGI